LTIKDYLDNIHRNSEISVHVIFIEVLMMLGETTQTEVINLTPSAVEAVKALLEKRNLEGYALRVFVSGGGCSGFQYGMAIEGNIRQEDFLSEFDGVKVVVDEISIDYLRGASIDYIDDAMGSGFKIENPNAISSCGCGSSTRTKDSADSQCGSGCNCG
jgi:iron-sulfur cluster assembly accessory protein